MHLANVENGVGIWMKKFKSVELPEDGHSATIEGGVISKDLVDALWERGKQTGRCTSIAIFERCQLTWLDRLSDWSL